jgi:hypothetical protein
VERPEGADSIRLFWAVSITDDCEVPGGGALGTSDRTLKQKAYHEVKEFLLIALYLWAMLTLLLLHRSIILAQYNIADIAYHGFAIINTLTLASSFIISGGTSIPDTEILATSRSRRDAPARHGSTAVNYDDIIIGAGPAGCGVAARLSEGGCGPQKFNL